MKTIPVLVRKIFCQESHISVYIAHTLLPYLHVAAEPVITRHHLHDWKMAEWTKIHVVITKLKSLGDIVSFPCKPPSLHKAQTRTASRNRIRLLWPRGEVNQWKRSSTWRSVITTIVWGWWVSGEVRVDLTQDNAPIPWPQVGFLGHTPPSTSQHPLSGCW